MPSLIWTLIYPSFVQNAQELYKDGPVGTENLFLHFRYEAGPQLLVAEIGSWSPLTANVKIDAGCKHWAWKQHQEIQETSNHISRPTKQQKLKVPKVWKNASAGAPVSQTELFLYFGELEVCQEYVGIKDYEASPSGILTIGLLWGTNILTTTHVEDGTLKQHFALSVYPQVTFEGLSRGKRFTREAVWAAWPQLSNVVKFYCIKIRLRIIVVLYIVHSRFIVFGHLLFEELRPLLSRGSSKDYPVSKRRQKGKR